MPVGVQTLSFAPNGMLYAANSNDDSLYSIDRSTLVTTLIGPHGAGVQFAKGFEIVTGCAGTLAPSGSGCNNLFQSRLAMQSIGWPCLGHMLNLGVNTGNSNRSHILVFGASNQVWGSLTLPFSLAPFGNPGCSIYASHDVVLGPFMASSMLRLVIPNSPPLSGVTLHVQGIEIDPFLPGLGVATSNLLSVTIGS